MKIFNKITSLLMFAAALTTSCSQDAMESDVAVSSGNRMVTFTVNEPTATRGSILTNSTFDKFTIYGINSANADYLATISMSKKDGIWSQEGYLELPYTGTTTFYAVCDQSAGDQDSGVEFKVNDGVGYVSYDMPSDIESQPTLVMSAPISLAEDATSFNVALDFYYTLAFVGFQSTGDYTISSLSISNFEKSADIAFGSSYSPDSFTNQTVQEDPIAITLLNSAKTNYLMIPLQDLAGAVVEAELSYDGKVVETKTIEIPATEALLGSGNSHIYTITTGEYVAPDYITPDGGYEDSDNNGAYELGDIIVGGEVTAKVDTNSTLTWASSKESVATVDSNGVVTGIGGGTATITATSKTDGVVISFEVTVYIPIDGANISIPTDQTNTLDVAATLELYATAVYNGAYSIYHEPFTVTDWSSSDTTVATVATTAVTTGTVTGVAAGTATITLTIKGDMSGNVRSTTRTVTVEAASKFNYSNIIAGDYIYSDGTTSNESSVSGKTCVGYIFHVDDDFALAVSPTAYTTTTQTSYWVNSSYTSQNIDCDDDYNGYYNMAALATYNTGYPKTIWNKDNVEAFLDDNDESKGKWYVPSRYELAYMGDSGIYYSYSTSEKVDQEFRDIIYYTGTTSTNVFWSSTEASTTTVYKAGNLGTISTMSKSYNSAFPNRTWYAVIRF